jgi:hypothetical protein
MFADTLEELHALAKKIGMRREWFQDAELQHYDLTEGKRWQAIRHGAQEVEFPKMVDHMRRRREEKSKSKAKEGGGQPSSPLRRRRSP